MLLSNVVAALLLGVPVPQVPVVGIVEPVPGYPAAVPAAELMSEVVTQTNAARITAGCGPLTESPELTDASVGQSFYMAQTGDFNHLDADGSTFVTRAQEAGYAQPAAENIAWGYGTADDVMAAWLASPEHRANILNCSYQSVGTGVVYSLGGLPYYTEVFGWQPEPAAPVIAGS